MSEPMPLYRKIAEDLRRQITAGQLAPGDRLKSEAELMEAYGQDGKASRNTVRDAIKFLASRGLVETRAGQGRGGLDLDARGSFLRLPSPPLNL